MHLPNGALLLNVVDGSPPQLIGVMKIIEDELHSRNAHYGTREGGDVFKTSTGGVYA
jgi:hypothetical protein